MRHRARQGFTLIEVTVVMVIVAIVATAAIPKAAQALADARETTALQYLRTIHTAQASFFSGRGVFAAALEELGPPPNAGLIPGELARAERIGYRFRVPAGEGYAITARPSSLQGSARSFYPDASTTVHHAPGREEATADSPELGASRPGIN